MTSLDWGTILNPLVQALVVALGTFIAAVLAFETTRLKAVMEAHQQAAAADVLAKGSAAIQNGVTSAAGRVALKIAAGTLDVTNEASVKAAAQAELVGFQDKYAQSLAVVQPTAKALLDGVMGEITRAAPAAVVTAAASSAPDPAPKPPLWPLPPATVPVKVVGDPAPGGPVGAQALPRQVAVPANDRTERLVPRP